MTMADSQAENSPRTITIEPLAVDIGAEIGRLLSADIQHFLTGDIENTAKIFNMRVKQAALCLLAQYQYGNFFAGRVNRRLQSGRSGAQDANIVVLFIRHRSLLDKGSRVQGSTFRG